MASPFSLRDSNINISIVGYFPCKPNWKIPLKKAVTDCIFFIEKGTGWVNFEGERVATKPGDLHVFKKGRYYELNHDPNDPFSVYSVIFLFDQPGNQSPFESPLFSQTYYLNKNQTAPLIEMYKKIIQAFYADNPSDDLKAKAILLNMISQIIEWGKEKSEPQSQTKNLKTNTRIHQSVSYIFENLDKKISVSMLAKLSHLTTTHFTSLFKEEIGESPKSYIIKSKINHAKSLLITTDKSIKEIAQAVGIDDPFYFSRAFKQITGSTPSQFKKSLKSPCF